MIEWKNNGRKKRINAADYLKIFQDYITLYLNAVIMYNGKQYSLGEYIQKALISWCVNETEKAKRK